jgi:hypothetical protein
MGVFLARRQDPNLGFPPHRIGFGVRAFFRASSLSRVAVTMWLTTSSDGPFIAYRCVLVVLLILRLRLNRLRLAILAFTGTDP